MIKTVTVKKQQKLHELMKQLKQKTKRYITTNTEFNYHQIEPTIQYSFYDQSTGHDCFDTFDELLDHVGMKVRKETYAHRD